MQFKVGDKVWVAAPNWYGLCTVIKMGDSRTVMFVRRDNGQVPAVYKSWASMSVPKNQQLLFNFMYES